ncbi:ABC transporter substrate-binding protein [Cellulosilyticum ruminicola]|uniref:ABC transporter substrate-binding protein n=1 Tax=Cellulosilyticum ruminicola TaxID=425254 RepID=UPI0006CFFCA4|nr:extracellular solute-binding protein [Cellulosilyticum ruminicola]
MKLKKVLSLALGVTMAMTTFVGCGSNAKSNETSSKMAEGAAEGKESVDIKDMNPEDVTGEINFITHRTDLTDTLIQEYITEFNKEYPNVKVNVEGITNYQDDIKVRMSTTEYGDVLMLPDVNKNEYSNFFLPLGTVDELSQSYRDVQGKSFEGDVYGIASMLTAPGVLYNKKVFEAAGITDIPKTPDEFLAAMQKIKDNTDAIPYYTNYVAQWTLTQWEANRCAYGDPKVLINMSHDNAPFAQGTVHYEIYKLMYDLVKQGLVEDDPMSTDWESSKQMIADGQIATMVLGEWAVSQVKALAANPDDIGYMPFPITAPDGKQYAEIASDFAYCINKNTKCPEAALAFLWWMVEKSGYAQHEDGIPTQIDADYPEALKTFEDAGVQFISVTPAPAGEEDLFDNIDNGSEVGTWQPKWKLTMVEAALGNRSETYDEICNQMNADWAASRAELKKKNN